MHFLTAPAMMHPSVQYIKQVWSTVSHIPLLFIKRSTPTFRSAPLQRASSKMAKQSRSMTGELSFGKQRPRFCLTSTDM